MAKCVYCGKTYEYPRGITFVTKEGVVKPICSSKCKKNMEMKRRKVFWIKKKKSSTNLSSAESKLK